MPWFHSLYLFNGSVIDNVLVLTTQPRMVLISEGQPSAENVFREIISFP
jgi:hypothetical protein